MPPETHEETLARELMRLGVTSRLKGAPRFHFWDIGRGKRETYKALDSVMVAFQRREMEGDKLTPREQEFYKQIREAFADPELNPYTIELYNQDTQTSSVRRLYVQYGYEKGVFKLLNPAETTQQITDHFYPIRWADFEEYTNWELMREVIPAMQVARAQLSVYEHQRWLYDDRSQRAAEVLAYRIQNVYEDHLLPASMATDQQQQAIFEEYADRLERGTNARRWFQDMLARLAGTKRTRARRTAN